MIIMMTVYGDKLCLCGNNLCCVAGKMYNDDTCPQSHTWLLQCTKKGEEGGGGENCGLLICHYIQ